MRHKKSSSGTVTSASPRLPAGAATHLVCLRCGHGRHGEWPRSPLNPNPASCPRCGSTGWNHEHPRRSNFDETSARFGSPWYKSKMFIDGRWRWIWSPERLAILESQEIQRLLQRQSRRREMFERAWRMEGYKPIATPTMDHGDDVHKSEAPVAPPVIVSPQPKTSPPAPTPTTFTQRNGPSHPALPPPPNPTRFSGLRPPPRAEEPPQPERVATHPPAPVIPLRPATTLVPDVSIDPVLEELCLQMEEAERG